MRVKFTVFPNMVMLRIKLKGTKSLRVDHVFIETFAWVRKLGQRAGMGRGMRVKNYTFSEHGHEAYNIECHAE